MLNCEEIARRLDMPADDARRISIVPKPDVATIKKRGGTSIDLRLGRWFRSFKQSKSSHYSLWVDDLAAGSGQQTQLKTNEHFVRFGSTFILHPGRFVLGVTMEWLALPNSISGYVTGKSSLGRHGLVIETAAGLHPNFSGCLTLELANVGEVPLASRPVWRFARYFSIRSKLEARPTRAPFQGSASQPSASANPTRFSRACAVAMRIARRFDQFIRSRSNEPPRRPSAAHLRRA